MWQIENLTPFSADRDWVRDRDGAEVWLVVLKATFDILPDGSTRVSAVQPPVQRDPKYHGEPGISSLVYDTDMVPSKSATDVIVVGHSWAPGGKPASSFEVGFSVGPLRKVLRVFGDRRWSALGMSAPQPFVKMPLVYERAYGGADPRSKAPERDWEWRNPVGCGYATAAAHAEGIQLPNVELPGQLIGAWDNRPHPAGFGALAAHWQPRASKVGTYDDAWESQRKPLPPDDFDADYFQCAPVDQQVPGFLRGGEPVALKNLTPDGELRFVLPRIHPNFNTRFVDGSQQLHERRELHTVILEPDFPRVSLVWHSTLPCHHKVQKLEQTTVSIKTRVVRTDPMFVQTGESDWG